MKIHNDLVDAGGAPRAIGAADLIALGYDDLLAPSEASACRFPDGGSFRIEIPSVEGPAPLEALLAEAEELDVPIHRVSQGSGVFMLRDAEIRRMLELCADARTELCLFLGPRAAWDIGATRSTTNGRVGGRARGTEQLGQSLAEAMRAVELGVRCLLVADEGVLWSLHRLRADGRLPADLALKVSAVSAPANPASLRLVHLIGADSVNVPSDLTVAQLAQLRRSAPLPIDFYVESPDDIGGFVRYYDAPPVVQYVAPVYLKFGIRNAPDLYPVGRHLQEAAITSALERVRRARLGLDVLERSGVTSPMSPLPAVTPIQRDRKEPW